MGRSKLSPRQTLFVQTAVSVVVAAAGYWVSYRYGFAPNFSGVIGVLEATFLFVLWSFLGATISGVAMLGMNLVWFGVQVFRHGSPTSNVPDDTE